MTLALTCEHPVFAGDRGRRGQPRSEGARGASLATEDGGRLIDFCCGFGDILLGHADLSTDAAVCAQWSERRRSLPQLEAEAADRLRALWPNAEAVRFAADPGEALAFVAAAARRCTGRAVVLICKPSGRMIHGLSAALGQGGSDRFSAVAESGAFDTFRYGDLSALVQALDRHAGAVAAVVLAPMTVEGPPPGYLRAVRILAERAGAALVFDEVQTGLRLDERGAAGLFGVSADVSVFGPGLANGYPMAALVGRSPLVRAAGALTPASDVSLAAACAVLDQIERQPVLTTLRVRGAEVQAEVEQLLASTGADAFIAICGDPTYSVLTFEGYNGMDGSELQRRFRDQTRTHGVFSLGAQVLSYAHGDEEISSLLDAYSEVLPMLIDWAEAHTPDRDVRPALQAVAA